MKSLATLLLTSVFLAGSVAYAHGQSGTWDPLPTLSRVSMLTRDQVRAKDALTAANGYYAFSEPGYQTRTMTPAQRSARCGSSLLQQRGDPPCTMFPNQELKPV